VALPEETQKEAARFWEKGHYWEVHELLEPFWLRAEGKERELLQGVIQLAAALHKARTDRRAAERILLRAQRHLEHGGAPELAAPVAEALSDPDRPPPFPLSRQND